MASHDIEPAAACAVMAEPAYRYDPQIQAIRAVRDLKAGELVPRVPHFALVVVKPGQRLQVRSHIGPVAVEREVTALQPAREGDEVFVRAADGAVFTASVEVGR